MTEEYRTELFATYDQRIALLDRDEPARIEWFKAYSATYYLSHLRRYPSSARILDIGCSRGYLATALVSHGFSRVTGIDLSEGDVEHARRLVPGVEFEVADAATFLEDHPGTFDVIVMKAVLEHVRKDDVLPLVTSIGRGLAPGGSAIIDVPNMDWLFAGHERYMDFTHEGGFTAESLQQILGTRFAEVSVTPADNNLRPGSTLRARASRIRIRLARLVLGTLLKWADPDGAMSPVWARSLVAIARSPISA